ncbi:MFS transporter [Streptomyces sp. Inha503]|uniref:MFS transporter n=1 Tax=Streptomyces sp. Inha503 TaxID=3383314 RepID=UPI0039A3BB11
MLYWIAVALDGFDLVVLGTVIPTLSKTGDLGFTDAWLTTASTLGLVGVGLGAVATGALTDRWGRRRTLLGSIALFSAATLVGGFAPTMTAFIILASSSASDWAHVCRPRWRSSPNMPARGRTRRRSPWP